MERVMQEKYASPSAEHEPKRKLWFDGPNYTADAVIIHRDSQQILLIQRGDTKQWALPGGFVDKGETAHTAAQREIAEETGANITMNGILVYEGAVEDPRNTPSAWIETSAYLFPADDTFAATGSDDAIDAQWLPLDALPPLYGSHRDIIKRALEHLNKNPHSGE